MKKILLIALALISINAFAETDKEVKELWKAFDKSDCRPIVELMQAGEEESTEVFTEQHKQECWDWYTEINTINRGDNE